MPRIKIEKFWPKDVKDYAQNLSNALDKKDFTGAQTHLSDLLEILKDKKRDGKSRVSICFIIDQVKMIDPLIEPIVDSLKSVLDDEKDLHVKEFAVWALGQLVEESQSIDLIKSTMPIFIKFCNDSSDHVKNFAEDIKERLNTFLEERRNLDEKLEVLLKELKEIIDERITEMSQRAQNLSKDSLMLDYKAAYENREDFENRIRKFKDLNAESEDEILSYREKLIQEIPAFKGESRELISQWREYRGEKEALIRRVHCILRIQGKIFRIISHITSKADGKIDIKELQEETQYTDHEIVDILKKLVDEEIIPNFMIDQITGIEMKHNISEEAGTEEKSNDELIKKEEKLAKK